MLDMLTTQLADSSSCETESTWTVPAFVEMSKTGQCPQDKQRHKKHITEGDVLQENIHLQQYLDICHT